jgi:protoheme ferro-lyase
MSFRPEPPFQHGTLSKTAVVLVNLGTPDAPTTGALRRYLKEFLSDPRVVEIPRALWWLILRGIILPLRPAKSAAKYRMIWSDEGSPLKVHTEKQALLLRGALGERGHQLQVVHAMRYAQPALPAVLAQELGLTQEQYVVTFQSRFGKAEWLQPYTSTTVQTLAKRGVRRLDVICPGFIGDCLETLEEIALEVKADFLAAGGREFHYIAALNERPDWIAALADVVEQHLGGWPTRVTPAGRSQQAQEAVASRAAALQVGALR